MKYIRHIEKSKKIYVALFTRAWIEMSKLYPRYLRLLVALFTRAWIEMADMVCQPDFLAVALFTRAWIEIALRSDELQGALGRPLHEGVD